MGIPADNRSMKARVSEPLGPVERQGYERAGPPLDRAF